MSGRRSSGGGAGRSGGTVNLDASGRTTVVAVGVGRSRVGVGDLDRLHVHGVGSSGVVGLTTSPLNGTRGVLWVTTSPDTDTETHRSLREVVASLSSSQGANNVSVNQPLDAVTLPVDGVGVESRLGAADSDVRATVEATGVTLAKVVGLDLGGITTEGFPVDLVQVIGLEHDRADNTSTRSSLQCDLGGTEKEVADGVDSRSIALLGNGERGTLATVAHGARSDSPVLRSAGSEVGLEGGAHSRVGGAGCIR